MTRSGRRDMWRGFFLGVCRTQIVRSPAELFYTLADELLHVPFVYVRKAFELQLPLADSSTFQVVAFRRF